jgi:hypothetical protein
MWIVRAPLIWATEKETITVPAGFETDLASIPRMVRGVPGFEPTGLSRRPAVLHDYLYASGDRSRRAADVLFYYALRAETVPELIARTYFRAVRLGGSGAWARHRAA